MDDGALPPWTLHNTNNLQQQRRQHLREDPESPSVSAAAVPAAEEEDICRVCRESAPSVALLHPWSHSLQIVVLMNAASAVAQSNMSIKNGRPTPRLLALD